MEIELPFYILLCASQYNKVPQVLTYFTLGTKFSVLTGTIYLSMFHTLHFCIQKTMQS